MIEFLLFWLFLLLLALLLAAGWLVRYALIPGVLLRAFFRSEWAPRGLKEVVGWTLGVFALLCMGGVGWSYYLHERNQHLARQHEAALAQMSPVRLTARQPGLLPFPLGQGRIEEFRYNTTHRLVVAGDLSVEGRLRASFAAHPGFAAPNETNTVTVTTDAGDATQATGRWVYNPRSRTVSGVFRCILPSGKPLSVSFPPTPVTRR